MRLRRWSDRPAGGPTLGPRIAKEKKSEWLSCRILTNHDLGYDAKKKKNDFLSFYHHHHHDGDGDDDHDDGDDGKK